MGLFQQVEHLFGSSLLQPYSDCAAFDDTFLQVDALPGCLARLVMMTDLGALLCVLNPQNCFEWLVGVCSGSFQIALQVTDEQCQGELLPECRPCEPSETMCGGLKVF